MSNFTTEQRYLLKLLIYRNIGHTSISYYCIIIIVIVTNYIDISRKMNYNWNCYMSSTPVGNALFEAIM